jgi:hypothetical protein
MNQPARVQSFTVTRDAFELRCWSRAQLYELGELDLHDAVDVLQHFAEETGLVAAIGQDEVQKIMADAFKPIREREWQPLEPEPKQKTAPTTVEALMWALREFGLSGLYRAGNHDRLRCCDGAAMEQICRRLSNLNKGSRGSHPDWPDEDIEKLHEAWLKLGGRP